MRYKLSENLIYNDEFASLESNKFYAFLKFAFINADMISLTTHQGSIEQGYKHIEKLESTIVSEIIDSEQTISTHCTTYGVGVVVFYFRISKAIKKFLTNKKSFWDFVWQGESILDDIAFYQDGICWLSTCTHENIFLIDSKYLEKYFDSTNNIL